MSKRKEKTEESPTILAEVIAKQLEKSVMTTGSLRKETRIAMDEQSPRIKVDVAAKQLQDSVVNVSTLPKWPIKFTESVDKSKAPESQA